MIQHLKRLFRMNLPSVKKVPDPLLIEKRITRFVLNAGLFWNNRPIVEVSIERDEIFYWHNSYSNGEKFLHVLSTVGVLSHVEKGYRLAIPRDEVERHADLLVEKGLEIETVLDALVCIGWEFWLETGQEPFPATFYDNEDGTTSFDCRQLMLDLVSLGYAEKDNDLYIWTSKMEPVLKENGCR